MNGIKIESPFLVFIRFGHLAGALMKFLVERVMNATTSINNLRCLGGTVWHNSGNTYLHTSFLSLTTTMPFFFFFTSIPFYPSLLF